MNKIDTKFKRKYPLAGLNLEPHEDKKLIEMLQERELTVKQLCRALIRQWMQDNKLTYKKTG